MIFQPQFIVEICCYYLHSCKPCLQSSEAEEELLQVDLLCNIENLLLPLFMVIPRRGLWWKKFRLSFIHYVLIGFISFAILAIF